MNFWKSVVSFFTNLGHTVLADIITALPEAKQIALQAITALIDAAIAYVEAKYGAQESLQADAPLSPADKLALDNQKRSDAIQYIKDEMAKNPSEYPVISDSLLNCGIELRYQLKVTIAEGNGGNFPGGNSNA